MRYVASKICFVSIVINIVVGVLLSIFVRWWAIFFFAFSILINILYIYINGNAEKKSDIIVISIFLLFFGLLGLISGILGLACSDSEFEPEVVANNKPKPALRENEKPQKISSMVNLKKELQTLKELFEEGVITEEQYTKLKETVLNKFI